MPRTAASDAAWYRSAGAYVGIGSAPAALVLGVGLAARHGGPPSVWALVLGTATLAVLLYGQGLLGMQPPVGGGASFSEVARGYLGRRSLTGMNLLLLVAMIGWVGFNVALGGTALAALVGVPPALGAAVLGAITTAVAMGGCAGGTGSPSSRRPARSSCLASCSGASVLGSPL